MQIGKCEILLPGNISFGDDIYIGPGAFLSAFAELNIESGVIAGPRLKVFTANHCYENANAIPYDERLDLKPVNIGANTWLGSDVIVLPGVVLGEGCIVGAGSVVTRSFEPGSIIGGNPAKLLKQRDMDRYRQLKSEDQIYLKLKKRGQFES